MGPVKMSGRPRPQGYRASKNVHGAVRGRKSKSLHHVIRKEDGASEMSTMPTNISTTSSGGDDGAGENSTMSSGGEYGAYEISTTSSAGNGTSKNLAHVVRGGIEISTMSSGKMMGPVNNFRHCVRGKWGQ